MPAWEMFIRANAVRAFEFLPRRSILDLIFLPATTACRDRHVSAGPRTIVTTQSASELVLRPEPIAIFQI